MSDEVSADNPDRLDRWLLEAGFDPDPDAALTGRSALELDAAVDGAADPWVDVELVPLLSEAQRDYLLSSSPALGAAFPAQPLGGGDPFGNVVGEDLEAAERDVIDFDD